MRELECVKVMLKDKVCVCRGGGGGCQDNKKGLKKQQTEHDVSVSDRTNVTKVFSFTCQAISKQTFEKQKQQEYVNKSHCHSIRLKGMTHTCHNRISN